MSGRKIPEELKSFFEDLNLRIEPEELFTKADLYALYESSLDDPESAYAESTFGKALSVASSEGIVNLQWDLDSRAWKTPSVTIDELIEEMESNPDAQDVDLSSEMEEPKQDMEEALESINKAVMFDLLKGEMAVAFRHVAENMTPAMIQEVFKDQIQALVKQEFKKEVIPAVMKNLEKIIDSTKEELQEQIDEKLDSVTIKSYILEVMREAFEFPTSLDMEAGKDTTEEP